MNERAGDHEPPFHAARQTARDVIAAIPETQGAQVFLDALLAQFAAESVVAGLVGHGVADRFPEVQVDLLRHNAEAGFRSLEFRIDIVPEYFHLATGLVDQ